MVNRLTLRQALDEDRLADFVAQAELRDYEDGAAGRLDRVIAVGAPKPAKSAGQTSRSRTGDGSTDSRTRRGKRASASH
jgi:hypothetical protein